MRYGAFESWVKLLLQHMSMSPRWMLQFGQFDVAGLQGDVRQEIALMWVVGVAPELEGLPFCEGQ